MTPGPSDLVRYKPKNVMSLEDTMKLIEDWFWVENFSELKRTGGDNK